MNDNRLPDAIIGRLSRVRNACVNKVSAGAESTLVIDEAGCDAPLAGLVATLGDAASEPFARP